jgi:hypothetical protein
VSNSLAVVLALLKALLITALLLGLTVFLWFTLTHLGFRTVLANSKAFSFLIVLAPLLIGIAGIMCMGFLSTHFDPEQRMIVGMLGGLLLGLLALVPLSYVSMPVRHRGWFSICVLLVAVLLATFGAWIRHYRKRFEGN